MERSVTMGTDIYGWVEAADSRNYPPGTWTGVIRIHGFVGRTYGMFGSLFGHRNEDGFRPIAADRGFPAGLSRELREFEDVNPNSYGVGATWLSWRDIAAIDWDEEGTIAHPIPTKQGVPPTEERIRKRKGVLTPEWQMLFEMMAILARHYGEEGVRIVAWFDY